MGIKKLSLPGNTLKNSRKERLNIYKLCFQIVLYLTYICDNWLYVFSLTKHNMKLYKNSFFCHMINSTYARLKGVVHLNSFEVKAGTGMKKKYVKIGARSFWKRLGGYYWVMLKHRTYKVIFQLILFINLGNTHFYGSNLFNNLLLTLFIYFVFSWMFVTVVKRV